MNFSCVNSPDRGTHEFIKIALDKNKKSVEIHYKWNDDYYNKYSGTRISSSTPIEKKYLANVKSIDNTKVVYASSSGKIISTFYYNGNLTIENSVKNGLSHKCKKVKGVEIAEKSKKQEPKNNQKEKGLELKQTLLQSTLVMKSKKNTHTIEFNRNGTGTWSMGDYSANIVWEVIDNNTFKAHQPKYNYSLAKINWKNLTLKYEDSRGEIWDYKIISPKKLVTLIAEKPKKKEPKVSIDDDKIVPAGSGSGFFVSKDGTVITNYHVIEGCELNKVSYKGSQSEAKVLSIDKVNDIAILKTNIKPITAFAVSNEDVSLLEDVVVAGYPLGKQISSAIKTHKGVVTALAGAGDNYSYFQTDAAINQGNSGGPIINQKGNVVGIAVQTWVEEGVQGVHFGIKSSTLKTFANANGLRFLTPNNRDLSNKELGKLITESTVYVECHMTIAQIKKMIAQSENKKALYDKYR